MARSSYIYLVIDQGGTPVAAFTVKHELITWLQRMAEVSKTDHLEVWRVRDGIAFAEYVKKDAL